MTTKHFAICPDGSKVTRSSQSRVYSHVVVCRNNYERDLRAAERAGQSASTASNYAYHTACLEKPSWRTEEEHAKQCDYYKQRAAEALGGAQSLAEYRAHVREQALARVAQNKAEGHYDRFNVAGWCSRPDLANKLFAKTRNESWHTDVHVLPAQTI